MDECLKAGTQHWLPMLGRAQAVVAVVRQPIDVGLVKTASTANYSGLLSRLAMYQIG